MVVSHQCYTYLAEVEIVSMTVKFEIVNAIDKSGNDVQPFYGIELTQLYNKFIYVFEHDYRFDGFKGSEYVLNWKNRQL